MGAAPHAPAVTVSCACSLLFYAHCSDLMHSFSGLILMMKLPQVYENGVFSRHLDGLSIGDTVDIRGPKGDFLYVAGRYDSITMLAGGTGITPMLQIVKVCSAAWRRLVLAFGCILIREKAVLKRPDDKTRVLLLFANVTEDDILLRDELDKWAEERADQFRVVYTVDKARASSSASKSCMALRDLECWSFSSLLNIADSNECIRLTPHSRARRGLATPASSLQI